MTERRDLAALRDVLACLGLLNGFCLEHGLEEVLRRGIPAYAGRALLKASLIGNVDDKRMALEELVEAFSALGPALLPVEEATGFGLGELRSIDPATLRESLVLYRRTRAGLLKELRAAKEVSGEAAPEAR